MNRSRGQPRRRSGLAQSILLPNLAEPLAFAGIVAEDVDVVALTQPAMQLRKELPPLGLGHRQLRRALNGALMIPGEGAAPLAGEAFERIATEYLTKVGNRREAFEDLAWSLLNSSEFISKR